LKLDRKERIVFRKLSDVSALVANNVDEKNVDSVLSLIEKLENELVYVFKESTTQTRLIWREFSKMSEEEIRREFANTEKYPDIDSIKAAVKGFLEMRKVTKVKTRETLIDHIMETYKKREHIGEIGR
jgi:hypothetical protein